MPVPISVGGRIYIFATIFLGALAYLSSAIGGSKSEDPLRYLTYVLLAVVSSAFRITLPGMRGTITVGYVFVMLGVLELTAPQTVVLACLATFCQCVYRPDDRPTATGVAFHVATMAIAVAGAYSVLATRLWIAVLPRPLLLLLASVCFFVLNTFPIAAAITVSERQPLRSIFREGYLWGFPCYIVGGCISWLFHEANVRYGWYVSILVFPAAYSIFHSYRMYLGRLAAEKAHAEQTADLHLRTIEALALAIEAKDHTTRRHLRRVEHYAVGIGKEMGLTATELEALRAAALLHDVGKLAVPEHIISKPGKLSREEFEKMKIHPVVGAEILEGVQFPYPVVPIVRAHHERWNGSGYPDGLEGEEIPLGARILAAVDTLDAMSTERQYRSAIPIEQCLRYISSQSGIGYDPAVVKTLERRFSDLESTFRSLQDNVSGPNASVRDHGFLTSPPEAQPQGDFVSSIVAARQEVQTLYELSQDLANCLSVDETLSVLSLRLKRIIPYDALAVYTLLDGSLRPEFVTGEDSRIFSSLMIPLGSGLSGWVAANKKPILNGNPNVEPGYLNDPRKVTALRSALVVPLEGTAGLVGVISLYHSRREAFLKDHIRILLGVSARLSAAIENAMRYRQAEQSATTDFLTGLPNARAFFLQLDTELARCRRSSTALTLMVADLNGFKKVNDVHGHLEGNRVLQAVAQALRECFREYDYVARMGGDEFLVLLPGLRTGAVEPMITRLNHAVSQRSRDLNPTIDISLSVGVAEFPFDGQDGEALLAEADRRMYSNKQAHHESLQHYSLSVLSTNRSTPTV